jgi:hypothetical protein
MCGSFATIDISADPDRPRLCFPATGLLTRQAPRFCRGQPISFPRSLYSGDRRRDRIQALAPHPGDLMIVPSDNADYLPVSNTAVSLVEITRPIMPLVATFAPGTGAGFYSSDCVDPRRLALRRLNSANRRLL